MWASCAQKLTSRLFSQHWRLHHAGDFEALFLKKVNQAIAIGVVGSANGIKATDTRLGGELVMNAFGHGFIALGHDRGVKFLHDGIIFAGGFKKLIVKGVGCTFKISLHQVFNWVFTFFAQFIR